MSRLLLRYILWRQGQGEPSSDVGDTQFVVNLNTGNLMWKRPSKYTGTAFSLSDADLIATAPTGSDVEEMEIDTDGYVIVTESA